MEEYYSPPDDVYTFIPPRAPLVLKNLTEYVVDIENDVVVKRWTSDVKAINDYVADCLADWEVQGMLLEKEKDAQDAMIKKWGSQYVSSQMFDDGLTRLYESSFARDSAKVAIQRIAYDVKL